MPEECVALVSQQISSGTNILILGANGPDHLIISSGKSVVMSGSRLSVV